MGTVADIIRKNLVYLSEHLCDRQSVLCHFFQKQIISKDDWEIIESKITTSEKSAELFRKLMCKDLELQLILRILRRTGNDHLVVRLEQYKQVSGENNFSKVNTDLKHKHWPEEKVLCNSFFGRNIGNRSYVDILHEKMLKDKQRTVVITQSTPNSKFIGLGGIGKTLTAKWYAKAYEKEYTHIIWIDCGEGSLLRSFSKLCNDLNIKMGTDSKIEEFANYCYEILSDLKCLWVFDNAEDYMGDDGIFSVMPKDEENFTCLITSRSRDWGTEIKECISQFKLNVFDENESVEFLQRNLDKELIENSEQLRNLGKYLVNLPLALELAVATLNKKEINIAAYIEDINMYTEDLNSSAHETGIDNFEVIIHGILKISLKLIEKAPNGKSVVDVLRVLAYICPDDIEMEFLKAACLISGEKAINETIKVMEAYSFVTRKVYIDQSGNKKYSASIHRLIQQALRHAEKENAQNTLRKILSCDGFLDYKLIPFRYADDEVKLEFKKIGAQLVDQMELRKLVDERRFVEAVELSELIHKELNSATSLFNYAVCLGRCADRVEEAISWMEILYDQLKEPIWGAPINFWDRILDLSKENTDKYLAAAQLFFLSCKSGQFDKGAKIFSAIRALVSYFGTETPGNYLASLLSGSGSMQFYNLNVNENLISLKLYNDSDDQKVKKKIAFNKCKLTSNLVLPKDLEDLIYISTEFSIPNSIQNFKIEQIIPQCLNTLTIDRHFGNIIVPISALASINCLQLRHVTLRLDGSRLTPQEIIFESLNFVREDESKVQEKVLMNEFLNIHKIKKLILINVNKKLIGYYKTCSSMIIGMKDSLDAEIVHLERMDTLDWENSNWKINKLVLLSNPFKQCNNMEINELLALNGCLIDFNTLPLSLEILQLGCDIKLENFDSKTSLDFRSLVTSNLLNLRKLHLTDVSLLSLFTECPNLNYLEITRAEGLLEINKIPKGIKTIKINYMFSVGIDSDWRKLQTKCNLNKLILFNDQDGLHPSYARADDIVAKLHPKELIIYDPFLYCKVQFDEVAKLAAMSLVKNNSIVKSTMGRFQVSVANENDFIKSEFFKYVDTISSYYLFQTKVSGDETKAGLGIPMEEQQFMEHFNSD